MTPPILDALLRLWNQPLPPDDTDAQAAGPSTDPVTINGVSAGVLASIDAIALAE
jgi:hypothetical protein